MTGAQLGAGNVEAAKALLASQSASALTDAQRNAAAIGGIQNVGSVLADPVAKLIGKLFGG